MYGLIAHSSTDSQRRPLPESEAAYFDVVARQRRVEEARARRRRLVSRLTRGRA